MFPCTLPFSFRNCVLESLCFRDRFRTSLFFIKIIIGVFMVYEQKHITPCIIELYKHAGVFRNTREVLEKHEKHVLHSSGMTNGQKHTKKYTFPNKNVFLWLGTWNLYHHSLQWKVEKVDLLSSIKLHACLPFSNFVTAKGASAHHVHSVHQCMSVYRCLV